MIIPTIFFKSNMEELVVQTDRWSLLGRVSVLGIQPDQVALFSEFVKRFGGRVDLQLELTEPTCSDALVLLNDGASEIITSWDSVFELAKEIPTDRIIAKINSDQSSFDNHLRDALNAGCKILIVGKLDSKIDIVRENAIQFMMSESLDSNLINSRDEKWQDCLIDISELATHRNLIADTIGQRLKSDRPDGLWPPIIVDRMGVALGLAYSNQASLRLAVANRAGDYWSRSRNALWEKGKTSGATQRLERIDLDCDRDCLRFTVVQGPPGFCHRENHTCFGPQRSIQTVSSRLADRLKGEDINSFTKKLADNPAKLRTKLVEEANELAETREPAEVTWEAADLLYFSMVRMIDSGVDVSDVFNELARRLHRVVRRPDKLEEQVNHGS